ncbi:MAG: allophanate hydrolase [Burkholderiales bacterium 68-20]|nr:MAG: allophanate hydrolase [Burkholderiales bacterium 68-20]
MRFLPAGDSALLVELPDLAHAMALHRALRARPIAGVLEVVPAARTLLLTCQHGAVALPALAAALRARAAEAVADTGAAQAVLPGRLVEIPVRYDGEDLPEVAERLGISVQEVIARHTGQPWQAAFAGFAPGFVYLAGGHPCFQLPRRSAPRTRVPAGAVALAGGFSAVYPAASPGGWQLIGVTGVPMWDMRRTEPAYVQPGFRVQFRDACAPGVHISLPVCQESEGVNESGVPEQAAQTCAIKAQSAAIARAMASICNAEGVRFCGMSGHGGFVHTFSEPNQAPAPVDKAQAAIEVVAPGVQTLVQDGGRHGMAGLGIAPSGALDAPSMRAANRLVGNPVDACVLESLPGGLQLRCHGRATLAVTGAAVPLTLHAADGRAWPVPSHACVALDDGDTLAFGTPRAGVRSYVAVRGGWQVALVLGSCATDTLAHIGPPALQAGQRLAVGAVPAAALQATQAAEAPPPWPRAGDEVVLDVVLGPRTDWFTPEALARLARQPWRVTPQSNRVGMRLEGAQPLPRSRTDELPSEGTVHGAIQVPANGQPVLFLADHPLTGGYPVIGAVASRHLGLAAQIPVGCSVRFNVIAPFFEEVFG